MLSHFLTRFDESKTQLKAVLMNDSQDFVLVPSKDSQLKLV